MRRLSEILTERKEALGLTNEEIFLRMQEWPWEHSEPPSAASVGHWINGTRERPRDMEHLKALCAVLDVDLSVAMTPIEMEPFTATEQALIAAARNADDEDVQIALAMLTRAKRR